MLTPFVSLGGGELPPASPVAPVSSTTKAAPCTNCSGCSGSSSATECKTRSEDVATSSERALNWAADTVAVSMRGVFASLSVFALAADVGGVGGREG